MFIQFCKYFFLYIFRAKTRQRLLFLAISGLFISSMALMILQSTMGGLQNKLISRSKRILGHAVVYMKNVDSNSALEILKKIKESGMDCFLEYELELLIRHQNYISPVIVHAVDTRDGVPEFLRDMLFEDMVIPMELAYKLSINFSDRARLISPSHVDSFMGDVPRVATVRVGEIITTDVPEIDQYHVWVKLPVIQNLIRKEEINRIRVYSSGDFKKLKELLERNFAGIASLTTWEDENSTLVWALNLESNVMIFLFIIMTILVSLCITSGLLVFFDKIKMDLTSFWIMGASKSKLEKSSILFLNLASLLSVGLGLLAGLFFLLILDNYGGDIMPDIFIDRKIPIQITLKSFLISFFVPYGISVLFSLFSLNQFKNDTSYLEQIRTIG